MCQVCIADATLGGNHPDPGAVHGTMIGRLLLLTAVLAAGSAFLTVDEVKDPDLVRASQAVVSFRGGSGFVASEDGWVVTANHVAEQVGPEPWVRLGWSDSPGPPPEQLTLAARNEQADLALYRLPEGRYPHITLRAEPAVRGETIAVAAHPPSNPLKISFGRILEAPTRWADQPVLEYTAPAYNGYSGGALLDARGRAVGVHRGWDYRDLGHGHLVAVPAPAVLEAFPQLNGSGS